MNCACRQRPFARVAAFLRWSTELAKLLGEAQRASAERGGAFDPGVGGLAEAVAQRLSSPSPGAGITVVGAEG
ncbi:MAG TPA: hypothetical protein VFY39_03100 [Gammaproteobacteria bacterium]|nr:hypothetical protein [Gammaproteobacteria bacterium]